MKASLEKRQAHEDAYVQVRSPGPRETAAHAGAVLYSAETLLENDGRRSGDVQWEVVCILASATENEPMDPLTMARNYLEKPGGTFADYSARDFAEAIWYWRRRVGAGE